MRTVFQWMKDPRLQFARKTIEIVIRTSRQIPINQQTAVTNNQIQTEQVVKYLGVMIDKKFTYREHTKKAGDKTANVTTTISRLTVNI